MNRHSKRCISFRAHTAIIPVANEFVHRPPKTPALLPIENINLKFCSAQVFQDLLRIAQFGHHTASNVGLSQELFVGSRLTSHLPLRRATTPPYPRLHARTAP